MARGQWCKSAASEFRRDGGPPSASLVEESQDRLLELGYCGRRYDDTTAEPQCYAKAEALVIRNSNELLDLRRG
jgi:hypothetical protein